MELALNLEWTAMAAAMCWLWVRHARREGSRRLAQFVSLALVLANMFVVITMYDDMAMAQNPAETRCFQQREDELGTHVHAPLHPIVGLISLFSAKLSPDPPHSAVLDNLLALASKVPATSSIQNRPPPDAASIPFSC
ncbi:MAG: hypothetical protein ACLPND_09185 [Candidatus Korobacteraceae bacterium]